MNSAAPVLTAAEAAQRLGVSAKALRLYEQRGLLVPVRTAAGWRTYATQQMDRAREIVALRRLGLSLAQVACVLDGEPTALDAALAAHQRQLEQQAGALHTTIARVRELRAELAAGRAPGFDALAELTGAGPAVAFDLPWPWGGERFELARLGPITWLTGPLGSGKTRLALKLAELLPGASFLPLDRQAPARDSAEVRDALDWLAGEGAAETDALRALLTGILGVGQGPVIVDLVEQGLDAATQEALAAWLRRRAANARSLILMTRSTALLDPDAPAGYTIICCPANHAPPLIVQGHPGAPGMDLVASCLAGPEVRARTEGIIAWRPAAKA